MKSFHWAFVFVFGYSMSASGQSVFTPLGTPGGDASWARDVSGDGTTVVGGGSLPGSSDRIAFRWRVGSGLEILGGTNSDAHAVSADGSIVVGQSNNASGVVEPFRWTTVDGLLSLGVLDVGEGIALGVSADGAIVVGASGQPPQAAAGCTTGFCEIEDPGSVRAFQWTKATGITPFVGFSDYALSQATGISADGAAIVGNEYTYGAFGGCVVDLPGHCRAMRIFRRPLRSLDQAPAEVPFGLLSGDVVANVSADGSTLVGREVEFAAFAWSDTNGFITLDRDRRSFSVARDTSGDGTIIVGDFGIARNGRVASLKNLLANAFGLDVLGWDFGADHTFGIPEAPVFGSLGATAISDDGSAVVGVARNPAGGIEAFHVALDNAPTIADFDNLPPDTKSSPLSSVLPIARSGVVGGTLRVFATLVNPTNIDLVGCGVVLGTTVPTDFSYQTSDPVNNDPVGTPDTPVDVSAGAAQSFALSFTPTAEFPATVLRLVFDCTNARVAAVVEGLNHAVLSASTVQEADVVAIARTLTADGVVNLVNQTGDFAVGAINIGPDETLTVSTANVEPPIVIGGPDEFIVLVCQSDPATGNCIGTARESVNVGMNTDQGVTFRVTVGIPPNSWLLPDFQTNRLQVLFTDPNGNLRGATSVAVAAEPP